MKVFPLNRFSGCSPPMEVFDVAAFLFSRSFF